MPQIIVTADRAGDRDEAPVLLRERVNLADFESDHFAAQLVQRLGWAVSDAVEAERDAAPEPEPDAAPEPEPDAAPEPEPDAAPEPEPVR